MINWALLSTLFSSLFNSDCLLFLLAFKVECVEYEEDSEHQDDSSGEDNGEFDEWEEPPFLMRRTTFGAWSLLLLTPPNDGDDG